MLLSVHNAAAREPVGPPAAACRRPPTRCVPAHPAHPGSVPCRRQRLLVCGRKAAGACWSGAPTSRESRRRPVAQRRDGRHRSGVGGHAGEAGGLPPAAATGTNVGLACTCCLPACRPRALPCCGSLSQLKPYKQPRNSPGKHRVERMQSRPDRAATLLRHQTCVAGAHWVGSAVQISRVLGATSRHTQHLHNPTDSSSTSPHLPWRQVIACAGHRGSC